MHNLYAVFAKFLNIFKIYESDGSHNMQADSLNRIVLISPFSDY